MKKFLAASATSFLALTMTAQAATLCDALEPLAAAVDYGDTSDLSFPVKINQGETECYYEEDDDLMMSEGGCYWDHTAVNRYTDTDTDRIAEQLKTCSFATYQSKISDEEGVEYLFYVGDWSEMYLGNDDEGIYIEIVSEFFWF